MLLPSYSKGKYNLRISKEDLEKILSIVSSLPDKIPFADKILSYVKDFLHSVGKEERTILARVKIRISDEIDRIYSKPEFKDEDKIKIQTLEEVLEIIKEEEKKKDISEIFEE